jgi:hypothetical protein
MYGFVAYFYKKNCFVFAETDYQWLGWELHFDWQSYGAEAGRN